jgi:hypothetical protein
VVTPQGPLNKTDSQQKAQRFKWQRFKWQRFKWQRFKRQRFKGKRFEGQRFKGKRFKWHRFKWNALLMRTGGPPSTSPEACQHQPLTLRRICQKPPESAANLELLLFK